MTKTPLGIYTNKCFCLSLKKKIMHRTLRSWILVDLCGDIHFKYYHYQNILITKIKKTKYFSSQKKLLEGYEEQGT